MDRLLLAGLRAFDRDDFVAAAIAWQAAPARRPGEADLLAALTALAAAAAAARAGDRSGAARDLDAARAALARAPRQALGVDVARLRREVGAVEELGAAPPPRPHPTHPHPARAWVGLAALLLLLGGTFTALRWTPLAELVEPERFAALLAAVRGHWWAPFALLGLYAALCPLGFPAMPLIFFGGAIFGSIWGSAWNILGTMVGATTTFWVARGLGREAVRRLGGARLERAERALHRHGFFALVSLRFLPIPFPFVNAAAAVAGVRLAPFLASSAIGLAPAVAIWTYFSAALVRAAAADRARIARELVLALALLIAVVMIPTMVRFSRRRRRLARFRAARRRRLAAGPG